MYGMSIDIRHVNDLDIIPAAHIKCSKTINVLYNDSFTFQIWLDTSDDNEWVVWAKERLAKEVEEWELMMECGGARDADLYFLATGQKCRPPYRKNWSGRECEAGFKFQLHAGETKKQWRTEACVEKTLLKMVEKAEDENGARRLMHRQLKDLVRYTVEALESRATARENCPAEFWEMVERTD